MKKIIISILLLLSFVSPVYCENNRIVDNAYMLTDNEISQLSSELDLLSKRHDLDIVVYFSIDTSFGEDIVSEGCEFFDNNGYGYGDDHRGILLIVNYETGYLDIITTGDDVRNKYDGYIEDCFDAISGYLRDNPYYAIQIFEQWVDTRFIVDNTNDVASNNTVKYLSVSGIIALLVSVITGIVLKKQLKTEGKKHGATNYIDNNSFRLTRSGDIFLFRSTSRRRIVKHNTNNFHSSGGGGSHISHTSSSGVSHGSGGGRRF